MDTSVECQKKEYPEEFGNGVHLGEEEGGRPRNTRMQEIMTGMKTKGLEEEDWNDRDEWRRKIKL